MDFSNKVKLQQVSAKIEVLWVSPSCVDTFIFSVTKVDKNYNFRKESSKNILIIVFTVLKIKINKKYEFYENKFPNLREKSCKFMRKKDIILRE